MGHNVLVLMLLPMVLVVGIGGLISDAIEVIVGAFTLLLVLVLMLLCVLVVVLIVRAAVGIGVVLISIFVTE